MKKFILCLLLLFFAVPAFSKGYDLTLPVTGDTIANESLQFEVVNELYSLISNRMPACFDYSVDTTQVLKFPYDLKKKNDRYTKGYWQEMWTVNACGKKIQMPVNYSIKPSKTVFYIDSSMLSVIKP